MKVRIEIKNSSKPPKKYQIENRSNKSKNHISSTQVVSLFAENGKKIPFREIVFIKNKMLIRRAGIDDVNTKVINENFSFTIPIDPELNGEYELVKIDEDTFKLERDD